MELKHYTTQDFYDSFEVNWTTGKESYNIPHKKIEERLVIFEAISTEYNSLLDFGYACAYEQYVIEKQFAEVIYFRNFSAYPPYTPWEHYKKTFIEYPIHEDVFGYKCNFCISGLREKLKPDFNIISATILKDEWNSIFIVAEYKDKYIGYWWKANF